MSALSHSQPSDRSIGPRSGHSLAVDVGVDVASCTNRRAALAGSASVGDGRVGVAGGSAKASAAGLSFLAFGDTLSAFVADWPAQPPGQPSWVLVVSD